MKHFGQSVHRPINIKYVRVIFFGWIALLAVAGFTYLSVSNQHENRAAGTTTPTVPCVSSGGQLSSTTLDQLNYSNGATSVNQVIGQLSNVLTPTVAQTSGSSSAGSSGGLSGNSGTVGSVTGIAGAPPSTTTSAPLPPCPNATPQSGSGTATTGGLNCSTAMTKAYNATTGYCKIFSSSCLDSGYVKSDDCVPNTYSAPTAGASGYWVGSDGDVCNIKNSVLYTAAYTQMSCAGSPYYSFYGTGFETGTSSYNCANNGSGNCFTGRHKTTIANLCWISLKNTNSQYPPNATCSSRSDTTGCWTGGPHEQYTGITKCVWHPVPTATPIVARPTATPIVSAPTAVPTTAACLAEGVTCAEGLTGRSLGNCCSGFSCQEISNATDIDSVCKPGGRGGLPTAVPTQPTSSSGSGGVGAGCQVNANCQTGLVCNQTSHKCEQSGSGGSGGTGASCTGSSQCQTGLVCNMTTNTCQTPATSGGGAGTTCTATSQCQSGLVCNLTTNACQAPAGNGTGGSGSACSSNASCQTGLVCVGTTNTCQQPAGTGTGTAGTACSTDASCQSGLVCNPTTHVCQSGTSDNGGSTGCAGSPVSITLNLKLKLQGINRHPNSANDVPVTVTLARGTARISSSSHFTADANGVWSNSTPLTYNTQACSGYALFIKAGQHLQKKVCDLAPQEPRDSEGNPEDLRYACADQQTLAIASGANDLNFSGISLPACDLPIDGEQDGVCDSLDMGFEMAHDQSRDAQLLAIGDLNHDGVINVIDRNIIRYVLSTQRDEER